MMKITVVMMLLLVGGLIIFGYRDAADHNEAVLQGPDAALPLSSAEQLKVLNVEKDDIYKGDLLLVNSQHAVPKGLKVPQVVNLFDHQELLDGFGILDTSIELPLEMLERFDDMIEAARADGVSHFQINSGYRDKAKQAELYEKLGSDQANPPGYSEHNLGLSMDIGSSQAAMKDAPEGKWLKENAWKYGFVLRYPEDKTDITGIMSEPWHFRYVGLPHSAIMAQYGFVLEEYLAYLKEQSTIHAEVGGKMYTISYYPVQGEQELSLPKDGSYSISGNNMDGVIVTTWESKGAAKS
ncbi:D-Ala-D-Ala carboxypeptidase [Paenibacillus taihuensis]|uniref:D-Ala-D-Ala carboxypeptidase n=1 Tax=Paenibacillus taihuensis TaxID=1156355 RepID=A0A3D9RKA5_9BACL|nr:M15 family metallopeptidase [Paenibacillus taihuensis]REE80177.1 D-Ala-D-Ala carboxypeptidase [Paenibacillus taihuensis]